jgi:hypothetical protein
MRRAIVTIAAVPPMYEAAALRARNYVFSKEVGK